MLGGKLAFLLYLLCKEHPPLEREIVYCYWPFVSLMLPNLRVDSPTQ